MVSSPAASLLSLPARGGFNLDLVGLDFGLFGDPNCVFLTWVGAGTTSPVCDGMESFVGEGEVASGAIVSYNDTRIRIRMPASIGTLGATVWAFNQASAQEGRIRISPPVLTTPPTPLHFGGWCLTAPRVGPVRCTA